MISADNHMMPRSIFTTLLALALATTSRADFVREIALSKEILYQQTTAGAATRIPAKNYPYSFAAEVDGDTRDFTVALSPAPKVTVHRNSRFASCVQLPVIPRSVEEETAKGFILSTTLLLGLLVVTIVALFFYLRARLRR